MRERHIDVVFINGASVAGAALVGYSVGDVFGAGVGLIAAAALGDAGSQMAEGRAADE